MRHKQNERQKAFFDTALDAIIVIDHQGVILEYNTAAERIFGFSRKQALGHEMATLIIPPRYRDQHRQGIRHYNKTGQGRLMNKLIEISALRKNGQEFPVELTIARIGDGDSDDPPTFMGTLRDITERRNSQEKLVESEARFRHMSDTMPAMIWMSDTTKKHTWFNKAWLDFTGRSLQEELGDGWSDGIHPDDQVRIVKTYNESYARHNTFQLEYRRRRHDGEYRWVHSHGAPRYGQDGTFLGFIGSVMDITETKQLRLETVQLQEVNRAKDEFIALASHQLRTPATGVKQYVAMLLQGFAGDLTDEQKTMLETAYESNERQLEVINALLNVAQLDAGNIVLKRTPCQLGDLLQDIVHEYDEVFRSRGQTLTLELPKSTIITDIDVRLMRMVFENIIDNACKYSPDGKDIKVKLAKAGKSLNVTVTDQGVGMDKRDLAKLFQKFSRIDNPLSSAANGSGLGLYWAKKVIDLHDGKIDVTSKHHHGSTFIISFPAGPGVLKVTAKAPGTGKQLRANSN